MVNLQIRTERVLCVECPTGELRRDVDDGVVEPLEPEHVVGGSRRPVAEPRIKRGDPGGQCIVAGAAVERSHSSEGQLAVGPTL